MSDGALRDRVGARATVGRIGVWSMALEHATPHQARRSLADLEDCGYACLWIPEAYGKEAFAHAGVLLSVTSSISVATGIANLWRRQPEAMAGGQHTLAEAYPGRFLLGIGVSFARLVDSGTSAPRFTRPVKTTSDYLDAMESFSSLRPGIALHPAVLAALGPRMLALAAQRTAGAHTYFVPVAHTAQARQTVGPDALLAVEQAVVVGYGRRRGHAIARRYAEHYLQLPHHRRNLQSLGWTASDVDGSARLIDAIVAVGGVDEVSARVTEHLQAGADHVCVQALCGDRAEIAIPVLRSLAPYLTGL